MDCLQNTNSFYIFHFKMDNSESWEVPWVEYSINCHADAEQLLSILEEAKIDSFKMQAEFDAELQHVEFVNELRQQQS